MREDQSRQMPTKGGAPKGLFVVALPIGNPDDLSPRAREILSNVDIVAAEDTRQFKQLCQTLGIQTKRVLAHHQHNEKSSSKGIVDLLLQGQSVAIVTDAGTPGVSDPGSDLMELAFHENIPVFAVPGASSLTASLSTSPIKGYTHYFAGFLSSKSNDRKKALRHLSTLADRLVVFEAPHRIISHLEDAHEIFPEEKIHIAREISKKWEEHLFLTPKNALAHFSEHSPKGEFVLIYPRQVADESAAQEALETMVQNQIQAGLSNKDILSELKPNLPKGFSRKDLYALIEKIRKDLDI